MSKERRRSNSMFGLETWAAWALAILLVAWQFYVAGSDGVTDGGTLIRFGARKANFGFPQAPWRLVASMFLHGGWMHLASNCLLVALWGGQLARLLGPVGTWAVFLVTGLWGSLLSDIYGPDALAIGASGGTSGMVLMILAMSQLAKQRKAWNGQARSWFLSSMVVVVLNVVMALGLGSVAGGRLDHWAHSGGAVAGLLLGILVSRDLDGKNRHLWLALLGFVAAAGVVIFLRGSTPFG